jgi:NADPH:quinone reductase-like Zn-dependent oxidoreductase
VKAAVQHGHGGLEVLAYDDVADPEVGPHDVLVRTAAVSLNRLDVLQRCGPPLVPGFSLPHIAGMDVAGTVVEVGAEVELRRIGERVVLNPALSCGVCARCVHGDDGLCAGMRVIGANRAGGFAELCAAPADHAHRLPDGVDFEEAATIPTAYATAWHALVGAGELRIGETLLVHGAGSGVTIAAIQIAKRCGARVIVTSRSEPKLELARRLGADAVVNLAGEDLTAACSAITAGAGVDIAFDHVGPALFDQTIAALRPRGRLVFCGTTTGSHARLDLAYGYHFGISLIGAGPYRAEEFDEMLSFYWQAGFVPVTDSRFALSDAAGAHARLESGDCAGKILLLP